MLNQSYINFLRNALLSVVSAAAIVSCFKKEVPLDHHYRLQPPQFNYSETSEVAQQRPIVNSNYVSLKNLNMNNEGNEITVKPGKIVQATLDYAYNCPTCHSGNNQIIVGLAKRSAQACIYNGNAQAEGSANFTLKMPAKPGRYEIRYYGMQAANCDEALKIGWNAENSPSKETTIGKIIVSKKAIDEGGIT